MTQAAESTFGGTDQQHSVAVSVISCAGQLNMVIVTDANAIPDLGVGSFSKDLGTPAWSNPTRNPRAATIVFATGRGTCVR